MADDRKVEPDIQLDCDLLILEYIVYDALRSLLSEAQDNEASTNDDIENKLRLVDAFLVTFRTAHPEYTLSRATAFLTHFLQFLGLFLHRHDHTTVSPSQTSLLGLRDGNRKRANGWREDAGSDSFPASITSAFAAVSTERIHTEKEQEHIRDEDGDIDMEDGISMNHKLLSHNGANGVNKRSSDEHDNTHPETVTLLDILPSFIHLSATRMAMGSMMNERDSIPDTYDDSSDLSDDAVSTDTLSWATEPQWLRLAASFMLQTILERYLDLDIPAPSDASLILEAFAWGYNDTVSSATTTNPTTDPTRLRIDKSLTIPDSDEGDITAFGTTPTSSPTTLPPSHSNIFILRTEKTPEEAGKAWRALRLQALSLLIPEDKSTSLQEHLAKVRLHHSVRTFEGDLLGFLTGLFYSVEEPVLVQLERVWPAWLAVREGGGNEDGSDMLCGEDEDESRSGWLEEAGEKVTVGGNELSEEEVEALMVLLGEWWD